MFQKRLQTKNFQYDHHLYEKTKSRRSCILREPQKHILNSRIRTNIKKKLIRVVLCSILTEWPCQLVLSAIEVSKFYCPFSKATSRKRDSLFATDNPSPNKTLN